MLKTGFGRANLKIDEKDLPIREFKVKLSDLCTRAAYLSGDNSKLLILSLDMTSLTDRDISIFREWISDKFDFSKDQIWVSATHTFAAPHLKHDIHSPADKKDYEHFLSILKASVIAAVDQAIYSLQPSEVWIGKANCPLNVNRNIETPQGWWLGRNLREYSNHDVNIVSFKQEDGHRSMIFNYDLQPSVFDHITNDQGDRIITGDIFGIAASEIENKGYDVAMPLIGAAGDQRPLFMANNKNKFNVNKYLLFEQSEVLKEAIEAAAQESKQIECTKVNIFELKIKLSSQKQQLGTFDIVPTKKYHFISTDDGVEISISVLDIGNLVIIGTQPEMNSLFSKECRNKIKAPHVLITTLMNGARKYLPEKKDFERITYEAMNTSIGINADQEMLQGFEEVNKRLKGEK